jgi:hypothetical protein
MPCCKTCIIRTSQKLKIKLLLYVTLSEAYLNLKKRLALIKLKLPVNSTKQNKEKSRYRRSSSYEELKVIARFTAMSRNKYESKIKGNTLFKLQARKAVV